MRPAARFLMVWIAGSAVLAVAGYFVLAAQTRSWFEADLALRGKLAVNAAERALAHDWNDASRLPRNLSAITRDERILGAAACSLDGRALSTTDGFPAELSCSSLLERMRAEVPSTEEAFAFTHALPSGRVHVAVTTIGSDTREEPLGVVVLAHDLRYLDLREETTRKLMLGAFFVMALGASLLTLLAMRVARRGWTTDLRRALKGEPTGEFAPIVRDVHSLAERLASEREPEVNEGLWSPDRLRSTLTQYLHGERVVIVANREPYIHEHTDGGIAVLHPASGLVSALEPVMRACSGVWIAHGSGSADREVVDEHDRVLVPPGEESYSVRRVWLSEEEENGYYYGFANEGLWPLCHVADERPLFRAEDYEHYVRVNRKFAEAVCQEVDSEDPIILVQDYHFALAPKMIRERLPRATIITFWHIPWPNPERIGICPWREELISGLLGSSVVGFHTQLHCNNFIDSVDAFVESRIVREASAVIQGQHKTLVRPYPISIEWPVRWLEQVPAVAQARREVREQLGLAEDALLGVGIDRLDYTKGIEERLSAIDTLLERYPEFRGRFTFALLAAPSRTKIQRYKELNDRVENLAGEINAKWSHAGAPPIVLLRAHHEPVSVFKFYRAADLCYVSSLHDGMNLVAKEFVAAHDDERGVLVLSQFTGAARDLTEALIVNPYDLWQASDALAAALRMPEREQRDRMRSMRRMVSEFNVYRWAGRMLVDAAELRRKERIAERFVTPGQFTGVEGV